MQALLPALRSAATAGEPATIVNVSPIGGIAAVPWEPWYHAAKFGLIGLSGSVRRELHAQGDLTCVVCPGGICTPFLDKTDAEARTVLDRLSPVHRALYGPGVEKLMSLIAGAGRMGSPPGAVATAIERLLRARRPRFVTLVGTDARLIATVRAILPQAAFVALYRGAFTARGEGAGPGFEVRLRAPSSPTRTSDTRVRIALRRPKRGRERNGGVWVAFGQS